MLKPCLISFLPATFRSHFGFVCPLQSKLPALQSLLEGQLHFADWQRAPCQGVCVIHALSSILTILLTCPNNNVYMCNSLTHLLSLSPCVLCSGLPHPQIASVKEGEVDASVASYSAELEVTLRRRRYMAIGMSTLGPVLASS